MSNLQRLSVPMIAIFVASFAGCVDVGKTDSGAAVDDGPTGFIGAPCEEDADCPYSGGICLPDADGLPRGTCSAECDEYCDDAEGHPTTFCIDRTALPRAAQARVRVGACVSRCNYSVFPEGGCRTDYGCQRQERVRQPDRETWACLPGSPDRALPACYQQLADRGVGFEADIRPPDTLPGTSRACVLNEAVWLDDNILGVDIVYEPENKPTRSLAVCDLGLALADTIDDVKPYGVTAIRHLGTYACRTVSGTSTPSRHAYGDAIDISGFDFADRTRWTLTDDWEAGTGPWRTEAGEWLYTSARRWHLNGLWSVILTPNYNAAHHDHFHVDLTPGSDYFSRTQDVPAIPAGTFAPAPFDD